MGLVAPRHVGSSWTRAGTRNPCIGRRILNHCATRGALPLYLVASGWATWPFLNPLPSLGNECSDWSGLSHRPTLGTRRNKIHPSTWIEGGGSGGSPEEKKMVEKPDGRTSRKHGVLWEAGNRETEPCQHQAAAAVTGWDMQGIPLGTPRNNWETLQGDAVSGN